MVESQGPREEGFEETGKGGGKVWLRMRGAMVNEMKSYKRGNREEIPVSEQNICSPHWGLCIEGPAKSRLIVYTNHRHKEEGKRSEPVRLNPEGIPKWTQVC